MYNLICQSSINKFKQHQRKYIEHYNLFIAHDIIR